MSHLPKARTRTTQWQDFPHDKLSHCIHCGFCLPVCPTYRHTMLETASPRGRLAVMNAVAQGSLPLGKLSSALGLCLGCRACEKACPSGVPYGELLVEGRRLLDRHAPSWSNKPLRWLRRRMFARKRWLNVVKKGLDRWQRVAKKGQDVPWAMPSLLRLSLRAPAPRSFPEQEAQRWEGLSQGNPGPEVGFFRGCLFDRVWGQVNQATCRVLTAYGFRLKPLGLAGCCGASLYHEGDREGALALAKDNIRLWEEAGSPVLVANAGGCSAFMLEYPRLMAKDSRWHQRACRFADAVEELSLVLNRGKPPPLGFLPMRVAYQDSCHILNGVGIKEEPRRLLRQIPGLQLVELGDGGSCCGGAGSYFLRQPRMANRLLHEKLNRAHELRLDAFVVSNPPCYLQYSVGGGPFPVYHLAQLLSLAMDAPLDK